MTKEDFYPQQQTTKLKLYPFFVLS